LRVQRARGYGNETDALFPPVQVFPLAVFVHDIV